MWIAAGKGTVSRADRESGLQELARHDECCLD
jgi:hypothetical protein